MSTQGKRLKKVRLLLNLTQEEFGARLGISKQFYSNIETDRTVLNNEKLVLLFKDYNVNLNYIIGGVLPVFREHDIDIEDEFEFKVKQVLLKEGLISIG